MNLPTSKRMVSRIGVCGASKTFLKKIETSLHTNRACEQILLIFSSLGELLHAHKNRPLDLVILDISSGKTSLEQVNEMLIYLMAMKQKPAVLVARDRHDTVLMRGLLNKGATGYILKTAPCQVLAEAIHVCSTPSSIFLTPQHLHEFIQQPKPTATMNIIRRSPLLDSRELSTFEMLAEGASNREISQRLLLSEATVRKTISTLLQKYRCTHRSQLIAHSNFLQA